MIKMISITVYSFLLTLLLGACSDQNQQGEKNQNSQDQKVETTANHSTEKQGNTTIETKPSQTTDNNKIEIEKQETKQPAQSSTQPQSKVNKPIQNKPSTPSPKDAIQVVAKPESIPVLVNKRNKLPDSYTPRDLVFTTIPFIFSEKTDKRKMRSEAAVAIQRLFTDALQQGVTLLGVSAYRSHATQVALFNAYVKKDGYEKARTYSALPGTSEHETGLAIDVTGGNGKCAAQDCFGGTKEAIWLQAHAGEYGFIIRYPKGKDAITGYKYEPWHLRYVGKTIATEIMSKGRTLEEYYNTIPVNK